MFLPIKANFTLPRFPIMTVLVCLVCFGVHLKQQNDWHNFNMAIVKFCATERDHIDTIIFDRLGAGQDIESCMQFMYSLTEDPEKSEAERIAEVVRPMRPLTGYNLDDSRTYVSIFLEKEIQRYRRLVPNDPDEGLAYYTGSWNPVTMITSSFTHGSWGHIIFNLVFFFAFAATVEALMGPAWFAGFIVFSSFFIGVSGSAIAAATDQHYSTVGLSGVVAGMMGLYAYLLPRGKIKCFYFFIVVFGTVAIPGWILAVWYIGSDVIKLLMQEDTGMINVTAHVMGGLSGYLFGVALLGKVRKQAIALQDGLEFGELKTA